MNGKDLPQSKRATCYDSAHGLISPESAFGNHHSAILLVGPTGSGKTPLGDLLEKEGFLGSRCVHFDFGANLRAAAASRTRPSFLRASEFRIVKNVLKTGALLKEEDFDIAGKILLDFIRRRHVGRHDFVIMNGLPRHVAQARAVAAVVDVVMVINLVCSPRVVLSRIRGDAGGDRAGRIDDSRDFVKRKLKIFRSQTLPLLDHYRKKRIMIVNARVTEDSSPRHVVRAIELKHRSGLKDDNKSK